MGSQAIVDLARLLQATALVRQKERTFVPQIFIFVPLEAYMYSDEEQAVLMVWIEMVVEKDIGVSSFTWQRAQGTHQKWVQQSLQGLSFSPYLKQRELRSESELSCSCRG